MNARRYTNVVDSLDQMNKTGQHVLDRFKCLTVNVKSRQEKVVIKKGKILLKR